MRLQRNVGERLRAAKPEVYGAPPSFAAVAARIESGEQPRITNGELAGAASGRKRRNLIRRIRNVSVRSRSVPLGVAIFALVGTASAAAGAVALFAQPSAPPRGAVPGVAGRVLRYDVQVTPDLDAGQAGWCSYPRFSIAGVTQEGGGGVCAPSYQAGAGVLLGGGEPISNTNDLFRATHHRLTDAQGQVNLVWFVVTARVAEMRLRRGLVIASRPDPRLPEGWRLVVAFVRGGADRSPLQINPVPLDASGRVIVQAHTVPGLQFHGGPRALSFSATRPYNPNSAVSGPCAIRVAGRAGVRSLSEVVATTTPALGRSATPNVLFSCARAYLATEKGILSAAILLGAQDPRRPAPPPPSLRPTGLPGVFREDGGTSGQIMAKRVGRAWLVVQASSASAARIALADLRAAGSAIHP